MSSGVAVRRPPKDSDINPLHRSDPSGALKFEPSLPPPPAPSSSSSTQSTPPPLPSLPPPTSSPPPPPATDATPRQLPKPVTPSAQLCEADLARRIRVAEAARDEEWRRHERAQIAFLQQEGAAMLKGLHEEIARLQNLLRDAQRRLDVQDDSEELRKRLTAAEERAVRLELALKDRESLVVALEGNVEAKLSVMREQLNLQAGRIRQLTNELADRTLTVTQLSSQLRQYRLREAMAAQQQRRRASSNSLGSPTSPGPVPIVSPSSPQRVFPPKSLISAASVSVSYPSPRRPLLSQGTSSESATGIDEKPKWRRRSFNNSPSNK